MLKDEIIKALIARDPSLKKTSLNKKYKKDLEEMLNKPISSKSFFLISNYTNICSIFDIAKEVTNYYNNNINSNELYFNNTNAGGKVRQKNGSIVENICEIILRELCILNKINQFNIGGKKIDSVRIFSKSGYIDASVDIHFSINNRNVLYGECKTYLDKCYLDRANSDLSHFKKLDHKNECVIISLENSTRKESENFFLDDGNINKIFYLVDGKRNSKKPIWKNEFYKPINQNSLLTLINYFDGVIKQYI